MIGDWCIINEMQTREKGCEHRSRKTWNGLRESGTGPAESTDKTRAGQDQVENCVSSFLNHEISVKHCYLIVYFLIFKSKLVIQDSHKF